MTPTRETCRDDIHQPPSSETSGARAEQVDIPVIDNFCLERFEWQVQSGQTETAARELVFLLRQLDGHYGNWGAAFSAYAPGQWGENVNTHLCTRLAGSITTLFSHPGFSVSDEGYVQLMDLHRWLALIFAVSSYGHGDHIIRNINAAGGGVVDPLRLNARNLRLFCLSYYPDSQVALQPELLWQYDKQTVARLFFALLSPRALPTPAAHGKREHLLDWLPDRLCELGTLDFLPTAVLHDVYMHCSYADFDGKHQVKYRLNQLIRQTLLNQGYQDKAVVTQQEQTANTGAVSKPTMVVVLEWFTSQHSVYRTHSRALAALREHFTVHAIALKTAVDDVSMQVFDECHRIEPDTALGQAYGLVREINPSVILYAGVGMFPFTIYLSNLRLAPLQLVGLGHGASTFCDQMDGFVVEEDFIGSEACFHEPVIKIPADGMPFVPPAHVERQRFTRTAFHVRQQHVWPQALPVRVAVCASIMKVNPGFLNTLADIAQRSQVPVQFCFYMGFAHGLTLDYLRSAIHAVLPQAEVNAHMTVQDYQQALNSCELFANPFPYGNMNGVVDVVRQGLPGVCLSGPEIHTHIDAGLFRRLGLPETLIAQDRESYIQAVLKLLQEHDWRERLQQELQANDVEKVLFEGAPAKFAQVVWERYTSHRQNQASRPEGVTFIGRARMTSTGDMNRHITGEAT
ncbi:cobalt ABC transporter permease [Salmonella enterica]|uniref:cobalt ABC transporter permease n=1 Tax=Salmonella enterica TaxID=28901 RepID=UPI001483B753|nr:cobalt ABC transporter permease [Salmonella enterica]